MGKAGKWIKGFLTGKKEKKESGNLQDFSASTESPKTPITIPTTSKEKKRWSFRRSVITKDIISLDSINLPTTLPAFQANLKETQNEQNNLSIAVPAPTPSNSVEETAAIKIQSMFRSYLARKALCALKGLVKLQALVRGYLVRKQAALTFRCMQALLTVQARAQAQRIEGAGRTTPKLTQKKQSFHRRSLQDKHYKQEFDRGMEEKIKTVEVVDIGELRESSKTRINHSNQNHFERVYQSYPDQYSGHHVNSKLDQLYEVLSPAPAAFTRMSPRTFSGYFEEYNFGTERNSPMYYSAASKPDLRRIPDQVYHQPNCEDSSIMPHDFPFFPNYMANTKSFKAKARSQSAPKQRPDLFERQPSRRKPTNVGRTTRMQRSTSHVGSTGHAYDQIPWPIKLDRSTVSLKDSECGSTSSILTDTNYSRSMFPKYEMRNHY